MNKLRLSIENLQTILDLLPLPIFVKDPQSRLLVINKTCEEQWGCVASDLLGTDGEQFFPEEQMQHFLANDRKIWDRRLSISNEEKVWHEKFKENRLCLTTKTPTFDDSGNPLYLIAVIQDITEQRLAEKKLNSYSERLQLASDAARIGICIWDLSSDTADWNQRNYEIFGLPNASPVNFKTWAQLVFPEDMPQISHKIHQLITAQEDSIAQWDFRIRRHNDNAVRFIRASATKQNKFDENSQIIIGVNQDITDFKQVENALLESEDYLKKAQAQAHLGSWTIDIQTNQLTWSDEIYRIFEAPIGKPVDYDYFLSRVHPEDRILVNQAWQAALQGSTYDIEHRIIVDDGTKWIRECADMQFSKDGKLLKGIGTAHDITHIKDNQRRLENSRYKYRQLASRIESVREEERKHIAREIHDELGQMLSSLRMQISLLRLEFPNNNAHFLNKTNNILEILDQTISTVRHIASRLRPLPLEMGILPSLEWLADSFNQQTGIECRVNCLLELNNLAEEIAITIYRIIQEALTNILRHSAATEVVITLKNDSNNYLVNIQDNGIGFDSTKELPVTSFGLISMQERASILNGKTIISSRPGIGTEIQVCIPIKKVGKIG